MDTSYVLSVCISNNDKRIVSGGRDGKIKIWDIKTSNNIKTIQAHKNYVSLVCYSSDSKIILSGGADNTVKIWDAQTGNNIKTLESH